MSESMPLYRQIFEDLRSQIESGELSPGDQLKSEAELMEEYGRDCKASRNTVRNAVRLLVGRGLVETGPARARCRKEDGAVPHEADPGPGVWGFRRRDFPIRGSTAWTGARGDYSAR